MNLDSIRTQLADRIMHLPDAQVLRLNNYLDSMNAMSEFEIGNAVPDMYSFEERKKLEELRQAHVKGEQSGVYRNFDAKIFLEETKCKHGVEENKLDIGDSQTKKRRTLGDVPGRFWMSDDFDATPDCFAEYM